MMLVFIRVKTEEWSVSMCIDNVPSSESSTCVPSKNKFKRGTGRGYPCMYMAIASSNRRALPYLEVIAFEFVF